MHSTAPPGRNQYLVEEHLHEFAFVERPGNLNGASLDCSRCTQVRADVFVTKSEQGKPGQFYVLDFHGRSVILMRNFGEAKG